MTAVDPYDDDEELDAREDLGYRGSREAEPDDLDERHDAPPPAPASERTGPVAMSGQPSLGGAFGKCRRCDREPVLLFSTPSNPTPTICAVCQAKDNRSIVEHTRDTIRALKAAAAVGNSHEERNLVKQLAGFVGEHQAQQTVAAIRAKLENGGGGRGKGAAY